MKAYTTRVGEGPLLTENKEISDMLHKMGRELARRRADPGGVDGLIRWLLDTLP